MCLLMSGPALWPGGQHSLPASTVLDFLTNPYQPQSLAVPKLATECSVHQAKPWMEKII